MLAIFFVKVSRAVCVMALITLQASSNPKPVFSFPAYVSVGWQWIE